MIRHLLKLTWNRKRNNALLAIEIFFSFLVLFAVTVFGVYFADNYRQPLGFKYDDVLRVSVQPNSGEVLTGSASTSSDGSAPSKPSVEPKREAIASAELLKAIREMPEVVSVAGISFAPYDQSQWGTQYEFKNRRFDSGCNAASDELATTLQLQVTQGRWFNSEDDDSNFEPVILNERLAHELFG